MRPRRRAGLIAAVAAIVVESIAIGRLGYPLAGNVVVRCRKDHLFTTIWLPGFSLKALRLGWWRVQYCPVGRHWSLVTPVDRTLLTPDERWLAAQHLDIRVP